MDIIYIGGASPSEPCPEETRKKMSSYVLEKIAEYNESEKYEELRLLFPPDYDPINWEGISNCVSQVSILQDNRLIVNVNEWHKKRLVYIINGNDIQLIEDGIFTFGKSHDKKYFAKVYPDRIDVCEGWDGEIVNTFKPPKDYSKGPSDETKVVGDLSNLNFESMGVQKVVVFPSGSRVGLASEIGVFVLDEKGSQFIQTESLEEMEDGESLRFDYPHIDVSPDEKYIAAGSQSSPHLVFEDSDGNWTVTATVEPGSSYPNLAKFNYLDQEKDDKLGDSSPQLLLCSCHFSRSASIALPINNITPDFTASGLNADESLEYIDDQRWVFAAGAYNWGWALGGNDGYIWFKNLEGHQMGYLHVGGTVMDIDYSEDRKKMIVASFSGQVIIYGIDDLYSNGMFRDVVSQNEKRKDKYAITNSAYKDIKRYLFLYDSKPMIW